MALKAYQLVLNDYDHDCGTSKEVLITSKNKAQLEGLIPKLAKKTRYKEDEFYIKELDFATIPDSLTHKDIKNIETYLGA